MRTLRKSIKPIKLAVTEKYQLYLMYNLDYNYIKIGLCKFGSLNERKNKHVANLTAKLAHDRSEISLINNEYQRQLYYLGHALSPTVGFNIRSDMEVLVTINKTARGIDVLRLENILKNAFGELYDKVDMNDNGPDSSGWFYNGPNSVNYKTPDELCDYFNDVIN
jgi:hypothetical protein